MSDHNRMLTAGAVVAAGLMIAGGAAAAQAANGRTPAATGNGASGYGAGYGMSGYGMSGDGDRHGCGGGRHTAASADETAKVTAAVKAKDSAVTVERVLKDQDGSYDVVGTKAGQRVRVEVSKDLATVEVRSGGHRGEGRHGGRHTPATADETAKVTAAVKAKDSAVTVERVLKDPDGSFHVVGTKAGQRVMVEVSKDLATVEVRTGGWGRRGQGGPGQTPSSTPGAAPAGYAV
ncbi:hypothetical protein [Arsenicicoccus sp. oral taxon 190]|uniref:hypothetical protein n=1 Tax=Arsenicicoccus sp. oral taxon 190 TaxID=1658671 RepID=UPI00067DEBCD|nr:hypothetical protein [Arsenicicoccus sp. oral taxon 190]